MKQNRPVLLGIQPHLAQTRTDLRRDRVGRVCLDNPAIAAQKVDDEQVRHRRTVGETPSLDPGYALSRELPVEFGKQPGLADTGLTDHADRLSLAIFDLAKKIVQNGKLVVASGEYRLVSRCRLVECGAPMRHPEQSMSQDRLGSALEDERSHRIDARVTLCREAGRFAQQDFAGLS